MTQNGYPHLLHRPNLKNWVRFLNNFRDLNNKIKRKLYPMPKINEMLFKLEGFQYATPLDLNIGYYHIWVTDDTSNLCTIILPQVK